MFSYIIIGSLVIGIGSFIGKLFYQQVTSSRELKQNVEMVKRHSHHPSTISKPIARKSSSI